jgi:hypothetical protein
VEPIRLWGDPKGRRYDPPLDSVALASSNLYVNQRHVKPPSKEIRPVKKLLSIAIALVFFGSFVGIAAASGTTTAPTEKKTEKAAEKAEKKADKAEKKAEKDAAKTKSAHGTVKSATADSIVVAGKEKGKDAEWTFAVDPKTKIKKGGKDATAADVKAGDSVQVKYTEDGGKATAQSVMAREPKAMKKAENPCAAKAKAPEKK